MADGGIILGPTVPHGDDVLAGYKYGEAVIDVDTTRILSRQLRDGGLNGAGLAAEIAALRADLQAANYQIAKNTQDTAVILREFKRIGMPATRETV